jgi:hypothetical protein
LAYLYAENHTVEWKTDFDAMHLMLGHRWYFDENSTIKEFDAVNIADYTFSYGYMCRDVLNRIQDYFPRN